MRCVLFLDMDGVLNSHAHAVRVGDVMVEPADDPNEADIRRMVSQVDPILAWNLGFIAKHVKNLEIVISSSWRRAFTLPQFRELFDVRLGLKGIRIVGATPSHAKGQKMSQRLPRIAHIEDYRREAGLEWSEVVILDDHHVATEVYGVPGDDPDRERADWEPQDPEWIHRFVQTDQRDGLIYSRAWDVIVKFIGWEAFKPPVILM